MLRRNSRKDKFIFEELLAYSRLQKIPRSLRKEFCENHQVSEATFYRMLKDIRKLPIKSAFEKRDTTTSNARKRLNKEQESLLLEGIKKFYLSRQKRSISSAFRETKALFIEAELEIPSLSTFERRIRNLPRRTVQSKRLGSQEYFTSHSPKTDHYTADRPMQIVQMDHTKLDIMVVETITGEVIGRPIITVAVDIYTRIVVAYYIDFFGPNADNVAETICRFGYNEGQFSKNEILTVERPILGLPEKLHMDNAREFKSEALQYGASEYAIELVYRPIGQPHYGGHVESLLKTLSKRIQELPGTTFSNIVQRGSYKSEEHACLSIADLNEIISQFFFIEYHGTIHSGLKRTPLQKLKLAEQEGFKPNLPCKSAPLFKADFSPKLSRKVQRSGINCNAIEYWNEAVQHWYDLAETHVKVIIDRQNITQIQVIGPDQKLYTIPAKDNSLPTISVSAWQQYRRAIKVEAAVGALSDTELAKLISQRHEVVRRAGHKKKSLRKMAEHHRLRGDATPENKTVKSSKTSGTVKFDPNNLFSSSRKLQS